MKVSRGASQALAQSQQSKVDGKSVKEQDLKSKIGAGQSPLSAQVSLSEQAQQIKKATDIAKDDSVDEQKIAYFQNLIDSGKYQVDSAKVADKLVDDHMKMPS